MSPHLPTITRGADDAVSVRHGAKRRGGRPSRAEAARLGDRIVEIATELLLANGYGATSIEDIARRAQISKRTFYHRYADKRALFGAVIQRVIERIRPPDAAALTAHEGPLDEVLLQFARGILQAALSPQALALYRMVVAEAGRFPDLAAAVAEQGRTQMTIDQVAAFLAQRCGAGAPAPASCHFAAAHFLYMVVSVPQRRALGLGEPMTRTEIDAWACDTVALFLNGYRASVQAS